MIRVVVAGAQGRLGRLVRAAVDDASDLVLAGTLVRGDEPADVLDASRAQVLVDVSLAPASPSIIAAGLERDISPVVGTSGLPDEVIAGWRKTCRERSLGALLVPNFSIGAVLQMRFAEQLARHMDCTRLSETHHTAKRDTPSATALATSRRIHDAGRAPPPIDSERRDGLVARQELRFERDGEFFELVHHVADRAAFVPGVLLAVRHVRSLREFHVGLEAVLDAGDIDAESDE